jgi:hypothetical protein
MTPDELKERARLAAEVRRLLLEAVEAERYNWHARSMRKGGVPTLPYKLVETVMVKLVKDLEDARRQGS